MSRWGLNVTSSWELLVAETIIKNKPNWIVQVGAESKLSVLYFAYILDRMDRTVRSIISVVKDAEGRPQRKNIHYLEGDPLDPSVLHSIKTLIQPKDKVMVLLEDGLGRHPIAEIQTYASLVTEGRCLIMGEKVNAFAMDYVEFKPDWIMASRQVYLRKHTAKEELLDQEELASQRVTHNQLAFR
jgi:cephalosporin hydroxylase